LIRPIPKKHLPNTVTYRKIIYTKTADTFDTDVTLNFVALQEKKIRKSVADGFVIVGNAVLFVDAKNSNVDGSAITNDLFVENSEIDFNDKTYTIQEIENLDYDRGKGIHHWELILKWLLKLLNILELK